MSCWVFVSALPAPLGFQSAPLPNRLDQAPNFASHATFAEIGVENGRQSWVGPSRPSRPGSGDTSSSATMITCVCGGGSMGRLGPARP